PLASTPQSTKPRRARRTCRGGSWVERNVFRCARITSCRSDGEACVMEVLRKARASCTQISLSAHGPAGSVPVACEGSTKDADPVRCTRSQAANEQHLESRLHPSLPGEAGPARPDGKEGGEGEHHRPEKLRPREPRQEVGDERDHP